MRVLVLSWDAAAPGALDPSVLRLGQAMADLAADVHLVALAAGPPTIGEVHGMTVTWAAEAPPVLPPDPTYDLARVLAVSSRTFAAADQLQREDPVDIVLAVGWQTAYAAANLHATHHLPVVAVLPTIEIVRQGAALETDHARLVHQIEWWLTYEARRVVTTSRSVRRELGRAFQLPADKLGIVPIGADVPGRPVPAGADIDLVAPPHGPAADAATAAARALTSLGLAVVLDGPAEMPVVGSPTTPGRIVVVTDPDRELAALNAMAAGRAVVVPETGPLRELVHARRSGVRVDATDATAILTVVRALLSDRLGAARIGRGAVARVRERHRWPDVARAYLRVAEHAIAEERLLRGQQPERRPLRPVLLRSPLLGLDGGD